MRRILIIVILIFLSNYAITWNIPNLKSAAIHYFNTIADDTTNQVSFNRTWAIHTDYRKDWADYSLGVIQRIHISNRGDGVRIRAEMFPTLLENFRAPSRYSSWFDRDVDGNITLGDDGWVYRYERYFKSRPALDLVDDLETRPNALEAWINAINTMGGSRRLRDECRAVGLNDNCMPINSMYSNQPASYVYTWFEMALDAFSIVLLIIVVYIVRDKQRIKEYA